MSKAEGEFKPETSPVFPQIQDLLYYVPNNKTVPAVERPTTIGPIFDELKVREPLATFESLAGENPYGAHSLLDAEVEVPSSANAFQDPYLYPVLTRNEYVRLTMLWYHTRDIVQDTGFLNKLENILKMLRESLNWEFAILGTLDNDHFTRLATVNLPLAILPRRESTCSHTVNMHPGTVFTITDLSSDWRFKNSPPVAIGGLRSYAGTQLKLQLRNGESVALGSLCVASNTVQKPLTEEQKQRMIEAADMITAEFVSRTRLRRSNQCQIMLDHLSNFRDDDTVVDPIAATIEVLKTLYPGARVSTQSIHENTIQIEGTSTKIMFEDVHAGLWEDTSFIQANLQSSSLFNEASQPIRGIIAELKYTNRALVVTSSELRHMFDNLDAWFLDQCAQVINVSSFNRSLKEALAAKAIFLRSITHELRTPLHVILSSAELLEEELQNLSPHDRSRARALLGSDFSPSDCLSSIRRSGTELMTIINGILRFNAFANNQKATVVTNYDLRDLEKDVLHDLLQSYGASQLFGLSIVFKQAFASSNSVIAVDISVLQELLKCLLVNAISTTKHGNITVNTSLFETNRTLQIDVTDTGMGIKMQDRDRPFKAFEKSEFLSRGVGLGLSIATQMASSLGGSLSLISSEPGRGSHYQLRLPYQRSSTPTLTVSYPKQPRYGHLPSKFHVLRNSSRGMHLLDHLETYLEDLGLEKSMNPHGALLIMNQPEPFQECRHNLQGVRQTHIIIMISDAPLHESARAQLSAENEPHLTQFLHGPFCKTKLDESMVEIDLACSLHKSIAYDEDSNASPTNSGKASVQKSPNAPNPAPKLGFDRSTLRTVVPVKFPLLRVLIVDDNLVNLKVLEMYCKRRQMLFYKACDGNEAVSKFRRVAETSPDHAINLVLMDLQMPECDGIEATRKIRAYEAERWIESAQRKCTIFMVTGQDSIADRNSSLEAGGDEYFVKPVSLKKLDHALTVHFAGG